MNRKTFIAAATLALLGATSAMAQEATPDTWQDIAVSKSRAQVHAELLQARKDGITKAWSAGYMEKLTPAKSREQLRNEVALARASGELDAINGEVYHFVLPRSVRMAGRAR